MNDYGASPAKIHVIPCGGVPLDEATVMSWIDRRRFDRLRILFIGRDWHRKGGDTVLAACDLLNCRSVPLRLDLVGVEHVPVLPNYARWHGPLDKRNPAQRRRLEDLLGHAHVLFVPSRAEITLPAGSKPEAFADLLHELFADPSLQNRLALTSSQDYRARLSWDTFGTRFLHISDDVLNEPKVAPTFSALAPKASAA